MDEQLIGSYKVLRKIGAGGMGKVYLAVHQDVPNLRVILKILSDPSLGGRFRQEADKLALLDGHPNICRIKHFFNNGDDIVIAMEYVEGITLDERVKSGVKMPVSEAIPIMTCLLDVLQFAHERDVFHRDIKPSNIMIDRQGQVKVIDFGIAKGKTDPNLTMTGSSCGTPAYMAPEQFVPTEDTDYAKADIYAAGTTLYNMLTGELPFAGGNEFAMRDAKLFSEPVKPRTINPEISKQLEAVILKALKKEPSERYESAGAMKKAIESLGAVTPRPDDRAEHRIDAIRTPKSSKLPMILGGVAVVLGVAAGWYFFIGKPTEYHAPKLTAIGDQTVKAEHLIRFAVRATADDGSAPSITAVSLPEGALFKAANNTFEWTPTAQQTGVHTIRFYAADPSVPALRDSALVTFTVTLEDTSATKPIPSPVIGTTGTLSVSVKPFGDLFVDGVRVREHATSATLRVDAGTRIVELRNPSGTPPVLAETLEVQAGESLTRAFNFNVPPAPQPAARSVGKLTVASDPRGAIVEIDGVAQEDPTPYTYQDLREGTHTVKASIEVDGKLVEQSRSVTIVRDSVHKVVFDFKK